MEKPFAITLPVGSSLANRTGSWRVERPAYVDLLPPCNDACPAGENVQGWLYAAEEGDYEGAWRSLVANNPMPAIMGRACFRPCETACNRAKLDEAVGINAVERFIGDFAIDKGLQFDPPGAETGKRVLVVGAGPAGLSAAYHLRRLGHAVTIYEAAALPGGMMRYGIPEYRLPRDVLDVEIARIVALGVDLQLGRAVDDLAVVLDEGRGRFDAVFLGVGAQTAKRAYIPAGDSARVLDALALLRSLTGGDPPLLGRRVAVYGGGDTAMDAARTARRLGANEAIIVYRRNRERMPAHTEELEDALSEGIKVKWLSTITHVAEGSLLLEKMALDEKGFPQPTGETEELDADSVVLALGQESDLSLVANVPGISVDKGWVSVGEAMMTGQAGVFAGGDVVGRDMTVTTAIGHGKLAARAIDAYLAGSEYVHPARHALAGVDRLNAWYYSDADRSVRPRLDAARRISTFDEVVGGLDAETAVFEARRCLSCGNCFECDNCFGVCPDNAVLKLTEAVKGDGASSFASGGSGRRYAFNYDYCKGCGLCAAECPSGSIVMEPERT
jgi:NADPH-dependent glutamate synthase beta subunit-like oxidoreductase